MQQEPLFESHLYFDMTHLQRLKTQEMQEQAMLEEVFKGAATCNSQELDFMPFDMIDLNEDQERSQFDIKLEQIGNEIGQLQSQMFKMLEEVDKNVQKIQNLLENQEQK